jgi:hypothetical protein
MDVALLIVIFFYYHKSSLVKGQERSNIDQKNGALARNRTSISGFGGLRYIRLTTSASYEVSLDSKCNYMLWASKNQVYIDCLIYGQKYEKIGYSGIMILSNRLI